MPVKCKSKKKLAPCVTDGRLLLSGFQLLVTLTLTLDRVIHGRASLIDLYLHTNVIEIGKKNFFLDGLTAGTPPNSRSRDTKTTLCLKKTSHLYNLL